MAATNPLSSSLRIILSAGVDDEGNAVLKPKTYQYVKIDATPDQVYQAAQALAGLSEHPVYSIERNDRSEIWE